jgi:hypothetical protein
LQSKLCELQRLLGKKTLEAEILAEILKEALEQERLRLAPSPPKDGSR